MRVSAAIILILTVIAAAGTAIATPPDAMAQRIAALVNDTVNAQKEALAFAALENLGDAGVPYLVGHLADMRSLPIRAISLTNKSPGAFEGLRHYGPET